MLRVLLIHWSELKLENLGPQLEDLLAMDLAIVHQSDRGQEVGRGQEAGRRLIAGEGLITGVDRRQEAEKECALEQDTKLLVLDTAPLHQASRRVKGTQQQSRMKVEVPCTTLYQIPRVVY